MENELRVAALKRRGSPRSAHCDDGVAAAPDLNRNWQRQGRRRQVNGFGEPGDCVARAGKKVGLVDADVYGPSQPTLLGTHKKPEAENEKLIPRRGARHPLSFARPTGVARSRTGAAGADGDRSPRQPARGRLGRRGLAAGRPAACGTGDVQLSLIQRSRPAGAVIVSTPQDLSLIDARRAVDLFNKTSVPVIGLIENMATYACPHCGEQFPPVRQRRGRKGRGGTGRAIPRPGCH